jgi:hypothetical protein
MDAIVISDGKDGHQIIMDKCGHRWWGLVSGVCQLAVAVSYVFDGEPVVKKLLNPVISWFQRVNDLASEALDVGQECSS